jgi:hypothetical protein
MAQWRSRTLGHTVRLLRARRLWQDYMPGTHRLVGSRGAKIGEAVRKNAQVDSGSQSSLSGSLGSLVGCALCPPVDRPLDGRRRASASLARQGELIAAVAPASGVDASASSETSCAPALDEPQSYRHRLATRSLTAGEAGVWPSSADALEHRPERNKCGTDADDPELSMLASAGPRSVAPRAQAAA